PSGFADWPRPFLFRACHLDGLTVSPASGFYFDLHTFDLRAPALAPFRAILPRVATEGLGPGRGRATLERVEQLDLEEHALAVDDEPGPPCTIHLHAGTQPVSQVKLRFETPTELKSQGKVSERPEFAILFGRLRDRLSTLRALYGEGPIEVDFRAM